MTTLANHVARWWEGIDHNDHYMARTCNEMPPCAKGPWKPSTDHVTLLVFNVTSSTPFIRTRAHQCGTIKVRAGCGRDGSVTVPAQIPGRLPSIGRGRICHGLVSLLAAMRTIGPPLARKYEALGGDSITLFVCFPRSLCIPFFWASTTIG